MKTFRVPLICFAIGFAGLMLSACQTGKTGPVAKPVSPTKAERLCGQGDFVLTDRGNVRCRT